MNIDKLKEELRFVGKIKKINWFNESLIKEICLLDLIADIKSRRNTTLRNIVYSLFPVTEYLSKENFKDKHSVFLDQETWLNFVKNNQDLIINLAVSFSTQGNIPQRAAVVLDFINRHEIVAKGNNIIIELGCSNGLLGIVLENTRLFFEDSQESIKYFWLKKIPKVDFETKYTYIGYEKNIPPKKLLPYFIWDKDKREKTKKFIDAFDLQGVILEQSIESFLRTRIVSSSPIIILTSFVLYHFTNTDYIINKIKDKLKSNVHWLDLSRNRDLPNIFLKQNNYRKDWVYLSYNGVPVAEIKDGSDDCPNWRYL